MRDQSSLVSPPHYRTVNGHVRNYMTGQVIIHRDDPRAWCNGVEYAMVGRNQASKLTYGERLARWPESQLYVWVAVVDPDYNAPLHVDAALNAWYEGWR